MWFFLLLLNVNAFKHDQKKATLTLTDLIVELTSIKAITRALPLFLKVVGMYSLARFEWKSILN